MRTISNLLLNQIKVGNRRSVKFPTEDLKDAFEISRKIYLGESERPYGAARGPPGVGKTAVAEAVMVDEKIEKVLRDDHAVFLYEAPTNELITSAFERLISLTVYDCESAKEFLRTVRLYGSLVPPPFISETKDELLRECKGITPEMLRDVISGRITEDVKIVISTEFQRASARLKTIRLFYLFVDEASTSPLYLPYTPLSDIALKNLMEERRGVLRRLFIVGDERQAIGLEEKYRHSIDLLVLPKIVELLSREGLLYSNFKHIGITLRLPEPTEKPLHEGFYAPIGGLQAFYKFSVRARELRLDSWRDRWGKCGNIELPHKENILNIIQKMLSSEQPLGVINIKESYAAGERVEPYRVKVAIGLAALFRCLYPNLNIAMIGPYQDLVLTAKVNYNSKYKQYGYVNFSTINLMLGKEADIVIAVLGKEWYGDEDTPTIYFQSPNLLNVQFSRHRAMLIVIGDVVRLRHAAAASARELGMKGIVEAEGASMIRRTMDMLLTLAGVEVKSGKTPMWSEGEGGVFLKVVP